jgi:hypothetical protein
VSLLYIYVFTNCFVDKSILSSPQTLHSAKKQATNLENRTHRCWDIVWQSLSMDLSSCDEGEPFGTKMTGAPIITWLGRTFRNKKSGGPVITWWGWTYWNKKFRWTCHHVMRMDLLEQEIPVDLSSRDEGGPFETKKFRWTCYHMMRADRADLPEKKFRWTSSLLFRAQSIIKDGFIFNWRQNFLYVLQDNCCTFHTINNTKFDIDNGQQPFSISSHI